jgi:pimeloyl-ACP methyl ester carboxylesterase
MKLEDPSEFARIFQRKSVNVVKAGKYAGYTAAAVAAAGGIIVTGGAAGPIAATLGELGLLGAASTGTAISSLSGAALTSASLAAIGGSVATGSIVITAAGAALGGIQGGVLANKYHSDDPSFAIRRLNETASDRRTIYINGFTEQLNESFDEWASQQLAFDAHQQLYGVNWSSKSRIELASAFGKGMGSAGAVELMKRIATSATRKAGKAINPLHLFNLAAGLLGNPWHTTMARAGSTGAQLAEALSRTEGKTFTLVGHSLGCRVIYYALEALATKPERFIDNVILLGGAVGRTDTEAWSRAASAVRGRIFNCYSLRDSVLSTLYKTANAGLSDPIGLGPIALKGEKIRNLDATDAVGSHFEWKPKYSELVTEIRHKFG